MKDQELNSFIYGGVSGAVARTLTAPIERVKILRQIRNVYARESLLSNLQRIQQKEGLRGYFYGNGANLYRIIPQQAALFGCYRLFDNRISNPLVSGALSGLISLTVVYPMKVIRTKLTVQTSQSEFRTVGQVLKQTPVIELYRGLRMAWFGAVPFHAINYYTYQKTRAQFGNFWAGCTAASVAILSTYPTDLMTRKYQLAGTKYNRETYTSIFDIFRKTYQKGGISGMYRGMLAAQIRLVPANGIAFMIYEKLKNRFG